MKYYPLIKVSDDLYTPLFPSNDETIVAMNHRNYLEETSSSHYFIKKGKGNKLVDFAVTCPKCRNILEPIGISADTSMSIYLCVDCFLNKSKGDN